MRAKTAGTDPMLKQLKDTLVACKRAYREAAAKVPTGELARQAQYDSAVHYANTLHAAAWNMMQAGQALEEYRELMNNPAPLTPVCPKCGAVDKLCQLQRVVEELQLVEFALDSDGQIVIEETGSVENAETEGDAGYICDSCRYVADALEPFFPRVKAT